MQGFTKFALHLVPTFLVLWLVLSWRAVRCPRSRRTDWTRKWLGSCAHGLGRVDCPCATADRS